MQQQAKEAQSVMMLKMQTEEAREKAAAAKIQQEADARIASAEKKAEATIQRVRQDARKEMAQLQQDAWTYKQNYKYILNYANYK